MKKIIALTGLILIGVSIMMFYFYAVFYDTFEKYGFKIMYYTVLLTAISYVVMYFIIKFIIWAIKELGL